MTAWRSRSLSWAILLGPAFVQPAAVEAQQSPRATPPPLIQEVGMAGADEISESALLRQIATRPTRCRSLLLAPFCLFSDGDVLNERHRLDEDEIRRDELRLRVIYFREGYREAGVTTEIRDRPDGVEVRFRLVEGPPTLIESFEVVQTRELLRDRDIEGADFPGVGDPLSLNDISRGMETLVGLLEEHGYLDARVGDSIEIVPEARRARVRVSVDPGPRSVVAGFEILGNEKVDDRTIVRALHLDEGDVATRPLLRQSRRALHASNLFHEVDVQVPEVPDSTKVVRVRVREAPPRLARIGGGVSTLEFGQLEGRLSDYNWFGGGRQLDLRAAIGNLLAPQLTGRLFFHDILPGELSGVDEQPFRVPTWQLSADFQQPAFRATANRLGMGLFANRRVIPGVSVDRGYGAEVSVTRRLAFQVPLSVSYRFEVTAIEGSDVFFCVNFGICEVPAIEALRGRRILSPVNLSLLADRSDDPLGPTTGYRVRFDVEHASRWTASDFRYHRVSGEASFYTPLWDPPMHVFGAHVRAGWVRPIAGTAREIGLDDEGNALLHPRKRFFAGGARSVRGFPENQLGPRILTIPRERLVDEGRCTAAEVDDGTCDPAVAPVGAFTPRPIGGTSVLAGSVEYRFPVGSAVVAAFVDGALVGGRLGTFVQDAVGAVTPGLGFRLASPVGPIRVDLGVRSRTVQRLPVVTEAEAPDEPGRRLVQLDRHRRFDPLEDEGRLGRILGRLTLHFSIGEAF